MKMRSGLKRILAAGLCVLTLASACVFASHAEEAGGEQTPSFGTGTVDFAAAVEKAALRTTPTNAVLGAGGSSTIQIPLIHDYVDVFLPLFADEIVSVVDPGEAQKLPFTFMSALSQNLPSISSGATGYAEYVVEVPEDAVPGYYSFTVNISYRVSVYTSYNPMFGLMPSDKTSSGVKTLSVPVYVEIVNEYYEDMTSKNPFELLDSITPETVKPGEECEVGIILKNITRVDLNDVSVTVTPASGFYFMDDTNSKVVDILSGGYAEVRFRMMPSSDLVGGSVQFAFNVDYENIAGGSVSKTYYAIVNVPAAQAAAKAELEIVDITLPTSVEAGKEFTVSYSVKNPSEVNAVNVQMVVSGDAKLINKTATNPYEAKIAAGETKTYSVTYMVPEDAETAYCPIKVELNYSSEGASDEITKSAAAGVLINAKAKPDIRITNNIAASVTAGGSFKLSVTVTNEGGDAKDLVLKAMANAGGIVPTSQSTIQIASLKSGESVTKEISFLTDKSAPNGSNLISVTVEAAGVSAQQYTSINVINREEKDEPDSVDMPVVIISDYDFGEDVYGGGTFVLTLEFYNTSKTSAVKDMKVTVDNADATSAGAVFTPVSSSNTFFIEALGTGEKIQRSIELSVASAIDPKSYGISVSFEYKNPAGVSKTDAEKITVPVKQKLRFNVGEISSLTDITTNEEAYLTVNFGNLGMSMIYNVVVKVEGEGFISYSPEYYAGNIESGKNLSYDFYLMPNGAGQATGTVTYSYEDSSGEAFSEVQEFSFFIMEAGDMYADVGIIMPDMGMDGVMFDEFGNPIDPMAAEDEGTGWFGLAWWIWYSIGGILLAIILMTVVVIVKKRKRAAEDEDY